MHGSCGGPHPTWRIYIRTAQSAARSPYERQAPDSPMKTSVNVCHSDSCKISGYEKMKVDLTCLVLSRSDDDDLLQK